MLLLWTDSMWTAAESQLEKIFPQSEHVVGLDAVLVGWLEQWARAACPASMTALLVV